MFVVARFSKENQLLSGDERPELSENNKLIRKHRDPIIFQLSFPSFDLSLVPEIAYQFLRKSRRLWSIEANDSAQKSTA
jgi:hypothetical protein